jgi:putative lipoprotein
LPIIASTIRMHRPLLLLALLLSAANLLHAQGAPSGAVAGTVSYKQRFALPPDAAVEVRLQDTSRIDAPALLIGRVTIPAGGAQGPIPFRVDYDPATIDPSHNYTVRAIITVGGRVLFSSPMAYPVLTRGAGSAAAIDVYMVLPGGTSDSAGAEPALENTYWKLASLGALPALVFPDHQGASLRLHPEDHRISGSGGCNRLLGSYDVAAGKLKLTPGGSTMMMCPEELMRQESDFIAALEMTTNYRLDGDTLELRNGERVLARFMTRKPDKPTGKH